MQETIVRLPEETNVALEQLATQTGQSPAAIITQAVISYLQIHLSSNPLPQTQQTLSLDQRRTFLKLPLEERRRILQAQAEALVTHYQADPEWLELQAGDIIDF
jgi:hypothetical protein